MENYFSYMFWFVGDTIVCMVSTEKEYFDKNYNISYLSDDAPTPTNRQILHHYIASLIVYGVGILLLYFNPWFVKLLSKQCYGWTLKEFFFLLYIEYVFVAPYFLFRYKPKSVLISKNLAICNYLKRFFTIKLGSPMSVDTIKQELSILKPTYFELQSVISFLIKLFYGPLMCTTVFSISLEFITNYPQLLLLFKNMVSASGYHEIILILTNKLYFSILSAIFFVDTLVFSIGYLTELPCLDNKIRTVESSALGLAVCLACYSPFANPTNAFLGWNSSQSAMFINDTTCIYTFILRIGVISLFLIYVWASVALGFKASNLTNRGTVSKGPYGIVRHPAYTAKVTCWWLLALPLFIVNFYSPTFCLRQYLLNSLFIFGSLSAWSFIYYLRALTEERHLIKDPDYQAYTQKVKYRFVPHVI